MDKVFKRDMLTVHVYPTRSDMGSSAAAAIGAKLRQLLSEKETVKVMFAAAPSQSEVHTALLEESGIDWQRVNAFHMDEYVNLDPEHPAGFRNFLKRALFDRIPFCSVHLINGNAPDTALEAERYAGLLKANHMDVCVMGVGENGHIAFNDPCVAHFDDDRLVKVVKLDQVCRQQQVNDGCFFELNQVPCEALTVTIPGLLQADTIFCIVPAATKAEAIRRTLQEPISESCPASILRTHADATMYLDADSASLL